MKTQIPAMSDCTDVRKRVYFVEYSVLGTILYVQVYHLDHHEILHSLRSVYLYTHCWC